MTDGYVGGTKTCTVPPPGWRCTREAGHDGPCAAVEDRGTNLAARAVVSLAKDAALVALFIAAMVVVLFLTGRYPRTVIAIVSLIGVGIAILLRMEKIMKQDEIAAHRKQYRGE